MDRIDLRSDTVTLPSEAMRAAMARAPVGDDQYGEDPSVNALQDRIAGLLGKEAALFLPSGTMANQIGLKLLTRPGDDVIVGEEAHIVWHESGAGAANSGVQFTTVGSGGLFSAADLRAACKPAGHIVFPPTTLVAIENTHNRGGGVVWPQDEVDAICRAARDFGLSSYLDGARLFNAAAASGRSLADLAAPFDVVSVALSKGLGCPVGSVIAGRKADMTRAVRARRMFGGAMRQSGILAAAGLYALDHNMTRLAEDHANARLLAERVAGTRAEIDTGDGAEQYRDLPRAGAAAGCRRRGAGGARAGGAGLRVRCADGASSDTFECRYGTLPAGRRGSGADCRALRGWVGSRAVGSPISVVGRYPMSVRKSGHAIQTPAPLGGGGLGEGSNRENIFVSTPPTSVDAARLPGICDETRMQRQRLCPADQQLGIRHRAGEAADVMTDVEDA